MIILGHSGPERMNSLQLQSCIECGFNKNLFPFCRTFSGSWGPIYCLLIVEPALLVFCSEICLLWQWDAQGIFFSYFRFNMPGFMLYLIHLDLSYVQGDKYLSICILLHTDNQFDKQHLLKIISFFHCMFLASLSRIRCPYVYGFVSGS